MDDRPFHEFLAAILPLVVSSADAPPVRGEPDQYRGLKPPPPRPKLGVGRNDPCPCGSGKKFKKCCLRRG